MSTSTTALPLTSRTRMRLLALVGALAMLLPTTVLAPPAGAANDPQVNLDQWANANAQWQNGNLNQNNSVWLEGESVPFRAILTDLDKYDADGDPTNGNQHSITIAWDNFHSGAHAYDYITSWDRTDPSADPCLGLLWCDSAAATAAIPADPNAVNQAAGQVLSMYSSTLGGIVTFDGVGPYGGAGTDTTSLTINFTSPVGATSAVLAWGGHLAAPGDWSPELTAGDIDGSGYHMSVVTLDGKGGNQDRSLKSLAVLVPEITVDKTASPTSGYPGTLITYTYVVTNTGETDLANVTLTDDKLGAITLSTTTLAEGASTTATASYTLLQGDVAGSPLVNVATTTGDWSYLNRSGQVSDQDDASVAVYSPSITVDKTGSTTTASDAGDVITYTFQVTNNGNVTLTGVAATDTVLGALTLGTTTLTPGASTWATGTLSYTITQTDVNAGSHSNTVNAEGYDPNNLKVTASDSWTVTIAPDPSIMVVKTGSTSTASAAGDTVVYGFTVTNTGNVTLTGVTLSDTDLGSLTLGDTTLSPNESTTATASALARTYTITQTDVDAGSHTNTATATGTPPTGADVTDTDTWTVDIASAPRIQVVKQGTTNSASSAGDTVEYSFTVTNTGNVTLTGVTLSDTDLGSLTLGDTTLSPNESTTATASAAARTYTITQTDVDAGSHTNTATATGTPPAGANVTDTDTWTVTIRANPSMTVEKLGSTTTASDAGDTVTYTFEVTNTGNVTLTNATATDDVLGALTLGDTTLSPGESTFATTSATGDLTYAITQTDVDAGSHTNQVTASATAPDQSAVGPVTDDWTVTIAADPSIEVVKTGSRTSAAQAGDTVVYSFTVTNTGNVTLTGVTLSDTDLGSLTLGDTTLSPNESTTATASALARTYTITQTDVDAGSHTNTATATGTPPTGADVTDTDTWTVSIASAALLTVDKTGSRSTASVAGDTVVYSFTVTNTGNVTLTNVTLSDTDLGNLTLGDTTLSPNESTTATATTAARTYTITQTDVDAGSHTNTATATGTPPTGADVTDTDTWTVNIASAALLTVEKLGSTTTASDAGDEVTYTFEVTNTGNVTLTNATATDDVLGALTLGDTTLSPGESTFATTSATGDLTYAITQTDVDAGSHTNQVTASATAPDQSAVGPVTDDWTVNIGSTPGIDVDKTGSETFVDAAGDTVVYSFTVTNTGNVTLTGVTLSDTDLGSLTLGDTTLSPNESTTATATAAARTYTITQTDVDAGSHTNTATATGTPPTGADVTDTDTFTVAIAAAPALSVDKTGSTTLASEAGDEVTYTFTVTNTGNVTLTDVAAVDTDFGTLTLDTTTLAPGATATATGTLTYTITQTDADAGSHTNVVTATATAPDDSGVGPVTDEWTVTIPSNPSLGVVKTGSTDRGERAGNTVTYTFTVTNTGNVTLTDVAAVDTDFGALTLDTTTLAPGATATATGTYRHTLTQDDVDAGLHTNVVTATGTAPDDSGVGPVTDDWTVTIPSNPSIRVLKTADPTTAGIGDLVTYTYVITNTGNVTLTDIALDDDVLGPIIVLGVSAAVTLAPGASHPITATTTVVEGDLPGPLVNVATATGTAPDDSDVTDTDDASVALVADPSISVTKRADAASLNVGDVVTYTYIIENTGDVTLTDLTLVDDVLGTILGKPGDSVVNLAPGKTLELNVSQTVTEADLPGPLVNVAIVTGTPPVGDDVSDTDVESVDLTSSPAITVDKEAVIEPDAEGFKLVAFEPNDGDDETVSYTYVVTNTGDVTLTDVTLVDDVLGPITLTDTTLAPGAQTTGTATHVVSQADADAGTIANVADASGVGPDGTVVEAQDDELVFVTIVLPVIIERPEEPAPAPAPPPAPAELPRTGSETSMALAIALSAIQMGVLFLLAARRQDRRLRHGTAR